MFKNFSRHILSHEAKGDLKSLVIINNTASINNSSPSNSNGISTCLSAFTAMDYSKTTPKLSSPQLSSVSQNNIQKNYFISHQNNYHPVFSTTATLNSCNNTQSLHHNDDYPLHSLLLLASASQQ